MITKLRVKSFKSWADTGVLHLGPLTVLFGTNSSGKTSILQLLLMLKQTVESTDRKRVLHTGDENSIVDLGTFSQLIHGHSSELLLDVSLCWKLPKKLKVADPLKKGKILFDLESVTFDAAIMSEAGVPTVSSFFYSFDRYRFGMKMKGAQKRPKAYGYELIHDGYQATRQRGRAWPLPPPTKFYGFPDQVNARYQNMGFLADIVLELERLFQRTTYLGPLREYPKRIYSWAGEAPSDVGRKGELAVPAILAARARGKYISPGPKKRKRDLEETIAHWLGKMGIIDAFSIREIARERKDYEVLVQKTPRWPKVLITDVGFGLSQVLPVLVMCYYVDPGSVLLLEQPELHLHPSAQSWLADVFIDVVRNRDVQIVVESHSEHFLQRLLRRIAEGGIGPEKTSLYFCRAKNSASQVEKLDVDIFGDITNWPPGFFGDQMGELTAKVEAARGRRDTNGN